MGTHQAVEAMKMAEVKRAMNFQQDLYSESISSSHTNIKMNSSDALVKNGVLPAVDLTDWSSPPRSGKVAASKDLEDAGVKSAHSEKDGVRFTRTDFGNGVIISTMDGNQPVDFGHAHKRHVKNNILIGVHYPNQAKENGEVVDKTGKLIAKHNADGSYTVNTGKGFFTQYADGTIRLETAITSSDSQSFTVIDTNSLRGNLRRIDNPKHDGEFKEMHLQNRSDVHSGADALVYVRKDFDPTKPVHLVIYNHGFGSTVSSALQRNQIKDMMSDAPANTILVLPEWQANPGSRNGNSGTFAHQGKVTNMVQEIMQKTPALHGATLGNVDRIDIIAHSAGYSPTEAEIYNNPALCAKVHSITLLDALYDRHGFDKWLGDNIDDLSTGRKQFFNFSNGSTADNSLEQARLVASMLRHKGLSAHNYVADYGSSKRHVDRHAADMAQRSIVFASTTTGHYEIPEEYIGPTLAALNLEREQQASA